jgi:hypothetical protein
MRPAQLMISVFVLIVRLCSAATGARGFNFSIKQVLGWPLAISTQKKTTSMLKLSSTGFCPISL